ncbi:MAG TPA: GMC oxidoreductase [Solirubrobacteraceae bacterium]|nr:GMC oxidoreductase [Solirubrobacteraceae bacterium]
MPDRCDVCIVGTGFGGSISAFRLAELYRAAGVDPGAIVVLERGRRYKHTEFRQSMHIDHLSNVYNLIQGQGAQVVVANAVGGGSNLYLAASLRAPSEIFNRRDRRPGDGPDRRMWPDVIARTSLDPYYARVEAGLRISRPTWAQVSKSGGLWAATLQAAGHTCDRVPLAISPDRCVNAKWCHTGCIFGAKNTLPTNYLGAAERFGVQLRANVQVSQVRQSQARPYRYIVAAERMDNEGDHPSRAPVAGGGFELECKALVLAAGAMGTPPILMRSQSALPSLSSEVGKHLGSNGDHVAAVEYDPKKVRDVLGLPGYADFYKGKPITTMTYDYYAGRSANEFDGTRFTLQEIFLSALTNFLYDHGRGTGEPSFWGLEKKHAIAHWANRIELLAMVEDTNDGQFFAVPPSGGGVRPNPGPVTVGLFNYAFSEQSLRVREAAEAAIRQIVERGRLGRFMKLTETRGAYVAHPLGGCRMATSPDLGVVDDSGSVFGYEGLYCIDSSIVPTSLGVNPSLTIAALSERCADALVGRGASLGLPARPPGFAPGVPDEVIGERVVPALLRDGGSTPSRRGQRRRGRHRRRSQRRS